MLHQGQLSHFVPRLKRHLGLRPTWDYIGNLRAVSGSLQQTEQITVSACRIP
jgi:hypothetical protein